MAYSVNLAADIKQSDIAPEGTIWVCPACSKTNTHRYGNWDTSCVMWAVLCRQDTLKFEDGVLISAEAVNDLVSEIPW
jgi:hypothetical protein